MIDRNAESFIVAMHNLVTACKSMGLQGPTSINFRTGKGRNAVHDAVIELKQSGNPLAEKYVTILPDGKIEIDGVALHIRW